MEGGEARIVAYTKVFAIRARLDKRVRYITDGEKTSLASSITYISNPEKTEQFFFTSVLNCSSVDTALSEIMETKQQFGKMGGVLGYHFIQSFQPGEVTPEQAHAVGLEFAKRLFGKRYEVVISTHLNKHHLHNHLVVNSVSCIDGQKYHSSPESYYNDVRGTSDELCRENDLSVIAPQGKGKHYAEWKAEQGGKPTVRGVIRADIDAIIHQAYTYDMDGYISQRNMNVLVVGGSGSGKTRFFCKPNIYSANCSYLITDPKGELLRAAGALLAAQGYEVRVFNLIDPSQSDGYNPFSYIHSEKDVLTLIDNLIKNTTPRNASSNDPFWEKAEIALDSALMLYLVSEAPPEEQNFEMLIYMMNFAEVREEDDQYRSPLDMLFRALEEEQPNHVAVKQYKAFKQAAGDICSK